MSTELDVDAFIDDLQTSSIWKDGTYWLKAKDIPKEKFREVIMRHLHSTTGGE